MATSFAGLELTPLKIVRGLGWTLGSFLVLSGTQGVLQPKSYAGTFGFAGTSIGDTADSNPFVKTTSVRNLTSGITMLALTYFRCEQALTISLACGIMTGLVDGMTVMQQAGEVDPAKATVDHPSEHDRVKAARGAAYGHWILTSLFSVFGVWATYALSRPLSGDDLRGVLSK